MKKKKYDKMTDNMTTKVFETQAISEAKKRTKKGRVAIPSEQNVKEASDWVMDNKK